MNVNNGQFFGITKIRNQPEPTGMTQSQPEPAVATQSQPEPTNIIKKHAQII